MMTEGIGGCPAAGSSLGKPVWVNETLNSDSQDKQRKCNAWASLGQETRGGQGERVRLCGRRYACDVVRKMSVDCKKPRCMRETCLYQCQSRNWPGQSNVVMGSG